MGILLLSTKTLKIGPKTPKIWGNVKNQKNLHLSLSLKSSIPCTKSPKNSIKKYNCSTDFSLRIGISYNYYQVVSYINFLFILIT